MRKRAAFLIVAAVVLSVSCGRADTASQENDPAITSEEEAGNQEAETAGKESAENASAEENAAGPDAAQSSAESTDDAAGTDDADGIGAAEGPDENAAEDVPEPEPEKEVIPAEWVEEMSSVQVARGGAGTDYGYQTWVHTFAGHDGFYAYGFGNQYIFVIPDLELVITFTAPDMDENRFGVYRQFVNDIVSSCG